MNSDQQPYYRCPTFESTWEAIDYTGRWAQVLAHHKREVKQKPEDTLPEVIEEQPDKDFDVSTPQEDFTDFLSPYSNDEPKDSVNAVSPLQDVIGFTPDFDKSENMDYSLPHLGEPNNGFAVSREENFTDFLSPQVTVEPEAKNLAVSSRQEHLPNGSLSDSRAKNKGLSVSTHQDNLRQQGFTQSSPRFKQFLTDDTHSISSHQPSPPNVIPDSDTDQPPKYVSQRIRPIRRRQIPNYPHSTAPLPADIGSEEIITCYPNHLHGQTLLNLLETWTPREIAETCPAKEINKGMISTRVKYARQRLVPDYQPRKRLMAAGVEKAEQKTKKGKGKVREAAIEAAVKEAESGVASVGSAQVVMKESGLSGVAQPVNAYRRVNYRDPFEE
ncbi:hypothetical protein G7Y79_00034g070090 [Physcia stellaris]|nr:hypothetical protein G7Y79_00034g070090 [Physcia stellaris]